MRSRKSLLLALAGAALVAGCASGPYDYYYDAPYATTSYYAYPTYDYYAYGPRYYVAPAPSMSFGLSYNRSRYWR